MSKVKIRGDTIHITRRLEFDMGHTVTNHESKCKHLHGHRYTAEIVCTAPMLDKIGRVVDFGMIKAKVGRWIDDNWDHKFMVFNDDPRVEALLTLDYDSMVVVDFNPTAENMARCLLKVARRLLKYNDLRVLKVRLYETPNGWADAIEDQE